MMFDELKDILIVYEKFNKPPTVEYDLTRGEYVNPGTDWNFNGRYIPTVSEEDIQELLTFYSNWPSMVDSINFFIRPYLNLGIPSFTNVLDFLSNDNIITVAELSVNTQPYIYPIEIRHSEFIEFTSFFAINPRVLSDARQGKACIVFFYEMEGDLRLAFYRKKDNFIKFRELITNLNIPKENVILVHGDANGKMYENEPYTYYSCCIFPWWISNPGVRGWENNGLVNQLIPYNGNKLYVSYNRTLRVHKVLMLYKLSYNNLLDEGIISCGDLNRFYHYLKNLKANEVVQSTDNHMFKLAKLNNYSPDSENLNTFTQGVNEKNPATSYIIPHYESTFLSLVVETDHNVLLLTEKTFKAIKLGHPFILFGAKGSLEVLKSFGFKSFSNWWNEDYDNIDKFEKRAEAVIDILNQLRKKSKAELCSIRNEMQDILKYNQEHYNNIVLGKFPELKISLRDILIDINKKLILRNTI